MKIVYCLILLLCPIWNRAQSSIALTPLSIGDKVPDIKFNEVLNAPYTATSLATSADKLLLVDFWATWCSSCIKEFPKLDSLQSQFKYRLQILLVNNPKSGDDAKKILTLFEKKRNPAGKKFDLPVIFNDVKLGQLFPHRSIPHTVWIYDGKVKAITAAYEVTAANIEAVLHDLPVAMDYKFEQPDFDSKNPLLENGNGGDASALLSRSLFTHYLEGAGAAIGQSLMPDSLHKRRFYINQPLLRLYAFAFPDIIPNRMIIDEAVLPDLISSNHNRQWKLGHYFSYEQVMPVSASRESMLLMLQQDLDRQFNLSSHIEKRTINCYALVSIPNADIHQLTNTTLSGKGLIKNDQENWNLVNEPLSVLVAQLNMQYCGKPLQPIILDETGYAESVNLDLKCKDLYNMAELKMALLPYGLDIIPCKRLLPMLVLSKVDFLTKN